jgi:hypothetical protein
MLGGGHVRRKSIGSAIEGSPCVRMEKKKHHVHHDPQPLEEVDTGFQQPTRNARVVQKQSFASTSSSKFGGERMIKAQRGILERLSLEETALMAEGEDLSVSRKHVQLF